MLLDLPSVIQRIQSEKNRDGAWSALLNGSWWMPSQLKMAQFLVDNKKALLQAAIEANNYEFLIAFFDHPLVVGVKNSYRNAWFGSFRAFLYKALTLFRYDEVADLDLSELKSVANEYSQNIGVDVTTLIVLQNLQIIPSAVKEANAKFNLNTLWEASHGDDKVFKSGVSTFTTLSLINWLSKAIEAQEHTGNFYLRLNANNRSIYLGVSNNQIYLFSSDSESSYYQCSKTYTKRQDLSILAQKIFSALGEDRSYQMNVGIRFTVPKSSAPLEQNISELFSNLSIDVNYQNKWTGETALHLACRHQDVKLVCNLLERGASPHAEMVLKKGRDVQKHKPVDIARKKQNSEIVELLENAMLKSTEARPAVTVPLKEVVVQQPPRRTEVKFEQYSRRFD